MQAVLLANATAASLGGLRLRRSISQGEGCPFPRRTCWITAVAPRISVLRKVSSPARVITPSRVLPAVEWSLGVSPIHAEKSRPDRKAWGSGTFITANDAPIGPIAGT